VAGVAVCGAMGRMGRAILAVLAENPYGLTLSAAVEAAGHPLLGKDAAAVAGGGRAGVTVSEDAGGAIAGADVAIDFSNAESSVRNAFLAAEAGKPIVIGATGIKPEQLERIREAAGKTAIVQSPNMSVGVNVMFKVLDYVTNIIGEDFDIEIIEAHHNLKKDAPSGTAMRMAQIIAAALKRDLDKEAVYERKGMIGARSKSEIGIQTIRAGDIVGEHWVIYGGLGERLEFIHRAHSRDNFAKGAVRAAKWIVGRPNGLYDMQDVLGLKR